jgi:hypothetical protein
MLALLFPAKHLTRCFRCAAFVGAASLALARCRERDIDQPWRLSEQRIGVSAGTSPGIAQNAQTTLFVRVPVGVPRSAVALGATESLAVGAGARVVEVGVAHQTPQLGLVTSFGATALGRGSLVGTVYALGPAPLQLDDGAQVSGYVKTSLPPHGLERALLGGPVLSNVEPYGEEFRWDVNFPTNSGGDRACSGEDSLDLPPGPYDSVVVGPSGRLLIHSGEYSFESLDIAPDSTVEISNVTGPVYVWVRRALSVAGMLIDYASQPNIIVGYAGSVPATIGTALRATLVSPNAALRLPRTAEPHSGSFFARSIIVENGAIIEHRAFDPDSHLESPFAVCSGCALVAQDARWHCRAEFSREAYRAQGRGRACLLSHETVKLGGPAVVESDCALLVSDDFAKAKSDLNECLMDQSVQTACLIGHGYRPEVCSNLGYILPAHGRRE